MTAPPAQPRRRHERCGKTCPRIGCTCQLATGHLGLHQGPGGTPTWIRSVEDFGTRPLDNATLDELAPTGRVLRGPGR